VRGAFDGEDDGSDGVGCEVGFSEGDFDGERDGFVAVGTLVG